MFSVEYRDWLKSRENYFDWLQSDGTSMGLMKGAIEFEQCKHIVNISTSKKMWDQSPQYPHHLAPVHQCSLLLSRALYKEVG